MRMGLFEAAAAAVRTKDSALRARYLRVMRHRGHNKLLGVPGASRVRVWQIMSRGRGFADGATAVEGR